MRPSGPLSLREEMNRHLLDLCRRSERNHEWAYSGFLSPAEQEDFLQFPDSAGFSFTFEGGYPEAERRILVAGDENFLGYPAEPPVRILHVAPASLKFAEEMTHRDYLGAILGLGIERTLIGDILIRDKQAWFFCLDSTADYLAASLKQVRRTTVTAERCEANPPELQPRFEPVRLNVASERLDALLAALTGLYGVGIKVASCVSLFGLHHTDAFPVDVWMKRILAEQYPDGYPYEKYSPYNGIYQQYLFAYYRHEAAGGSEKT